MESISEIRRRIAVRNVTVWQGKKTHDHIKDLLVVIDERTGIIKTYRLESAHTHEGLKNGEVTPDDMYATNGFERARLFEDAAAAHQDEEVL